MSGPYDVPDDPDEVTLWAGRLRAWPTPPTPGDPDDIDGDTAISSRPAVADDTVRVVRDAPVDDTVRVEREEPTDDTVRVRRDRPDADRGPGPADAPADETVRVTRDRSEPADAPPVDETTAPGRRRGDGSSPATPVDADDEARTGDTAAGTRRARSRGRLEALDIPSGDPVPAPRRARVPDADHALYRPRADEAIRVTRAVPPARPIDAPDAAMVRPRTARRARIRGVILAAAVLLVVAGATITLFLLMG